MRVKANIAYTTIFKSNYMHEIIFAGNIKFDFHL